MQQTGKLEGQFQGQASFPVGGATQVIYARKSGNTLYNNYSEFQSKLTGAIQITFGVLLILTNVILLVTDYLTVNSVGHGIWGGVMLVVSGSVGVVASTRKTKCLAITYMIMCIISSLLSIPVVVFAGFGVAFGLQCRDYPVTSIYRPPWVTCNYGPEFSESFHILLLVFAVPGAISAIWGSTLCCKAAACCSDDNEELVPMQIVTANSNQKTLPGNSDKDYLKPSAVEGYEKLHLETGDEVYDMIEDDDVKDDPDNSGYEKYLQPSVKKNNENAHQNNYEKCFPVMLDQAESLGVAGYDKLIGCSVTKDDYVRYEKPANDYSTLEE